MAKKGNVGELLVSLRADMGQLKMDVQQVERTFKGGFDRIEGQAKSAGAMIGRSLLAAVSVGAVIRYTKSIVDLGGRLTDLADQTRFSAQLLSGMQSTLEQAGTSVDAFAKGIFTAQRNLGQVRTATDPVALAVKNLGLNLEELQNMSPEKFADTLAKALARIENPTQRAAIGAQILGRQYQELGPAIDQLAGKFEELRKKGISEADLRLLDEFGDRWTEVSNKLKVVTAGVLSDIIHDLESISRLVRDNISQFNLFRDRAGQGALLGGLLTQPGAAGLEDVLKDSLKKPPPVKIAPRVDDAAAKARAAAQKSFTDSLKAATQALSLPVIELELGEKAGLEWQVQLKEAEAASLGLTKALAPQLRAFRDLTLSIPQVKQELERLAEVAQRDSQDSTAWSTFADDIGKIGLAAQDVANELETMARASREAADDMDRAEWLPDNFGEGLAAEVKRITETISPLMQGVFDVLDSAGRGVNLTFQSIIMGTQSVSEGFQNLARNVALSMLEMTMQVFLILPVIEALKRAISTIGSGTGVGGFFSSLFGFQQGGMVPAFANGGMIRIPSFDTGGLIMAHDKEFVVKAPSVASVGEGAMNYINQTGKLPNGGSAPIVQNSITIRGGIVPEPGVSPSQVIDIVSRNVHEDGAIVALMAHRLSGKGR